MKNIIKKSYLGIIFISLIFVSCDKYLDEMPSKTSNIEISTTEHLDMLLANYYDIAGEPNRAVVLSSDDYEISVDLYNARPSYFRQTRLMWYLWDTKNLTLENSDSFFEKSYSKIFTANTVLENIDKVKGSKENKERLRAEAHFIRAYENWNLVNTYCLPYSQANMNTLGLSHKTSTSYEQSMERMSLKQTYDFIEEDLNEALKSKNNSIDQCWRGNIYAIKGFMARFLLFKGDYTNALKYAEEVLAVKSDLVDYNTEMSFGKNYKYNVKGKDVFVDVPSTYTQQFDLGDIFKWKEYIYMRYLSNDYEWYIPSKSLLNMYDKQHDLRYKYHIVENFSYCRSLSETSAPGYVFFYEGKLPSGITTASLLLIKAECLARLGRINDAMNAINKLRAKRMTPGFEVLKASSKDDAIMKVLAERRREIPFTMRWFDIRRLNNNETSIDDVVLKRKFYSYTSTSVLSNGSVKDYTLTEKRYAAPLIDREIYLSNGELKQNQY
ncbi:MAG: RagB/SusD family nutrient uptake outer membrane protein [Marinifilaceae bacterium]|jgi:hypothetical protein|nr:RagB/SusD family nutrient uptake outer membrane protein [Marinifilaceae bacterium]